MGSVSFIGLYCCTVGLKCIFVYIPKNAMVNYVAVFLPVQYNERRNYLQGSKLRLIRSPMRLTFSPWRLKILV